MSYRIKIVLYGFVSAILMAFTFGNIKDTIAVFSDYRNSKKSLSDNEYSLRSIEQLKADLAAYNKELGYSNSSDISNQTRLLSFITDYVNKHKSRISYLPNSQQSLVNGYEVETNIFQFEGDFKNLLQLIFLIEREQRISKVVSLSFQSKEDFNTKTKKLFVTAYFQNIQIK